MNPNDRIKELAMSLWKKTTNDSDPQNDYEWSIVDDFESTIKQAVGEFADEAVKKLYSEETQVKELITNLKSQWTGESK